MLRLIQTIEAEAFVQTLYAGSIRFNILLGAIKPASEVTQEEIEEACRNANILDFIESLPEYVSTSASAFVDMLTTVAGGSRHKSVARAHSSLVVRNVRAMLSRV